MGQISNLVLKNGVATPADVTFTPVYPMVGESPAYWTFRNDALLSARQDVKMSITENNNGTSRVRGSVTLPVVATDTAGVKSIQHKNLFSFEFVLPSSSAAADRKDIMAYAKNLLSHAIVTSAVVDLERQY